MIRCVHVGRVVGLGLCLMVAGCGEPDAIRDAQRLDGEAGNEIVVGVDPELPPYSFLQEDGALDGMVVDLVRAVAEAQGLELSFRVAPSSQLRQALRRGEIDVVPHWPQTSEPPSGVSLSLPHSDVSDGVFVRDAPAGPLPTGGVPLADWLLRHRAVVLSEDPAHEFVTQRSDGGEALVEASPAAVMRRLAGGDGDFALLPTRTGIFLMRQLQLGNLRVLPVNLDAYTRSLCFAVREDAQELLGEIERGMVIVTGNGTYLRIYNEWEQFSTESGPDLRWLLGVLGTTLFLLGLSTVWSWSLRRTVSRRTAELRAEEAERRRLEAQIQQTQKLESLGILAGGVAHDFNNLLMGILGNVSLARHADQAAKLEERLAEIERAGRRAAELTEKMLAYSGKGSFQVQRIDLSRMIRDLQEWISTHVSVDARIALDLTDDLPAVAGDEDQLQQLVKNLISNASEALVDDRGIVQLATSSRYCDAELLAETFLHPRLYAGTYVVLQVTDDGCGMPQQVLERAFDPFFSTKFTGRGLGLAATLGIVRGHRGAIRIDSTPNRGTRVRVYLPARQDSQEIEAIQAGSRAAEDER